MNDIAISQSQEDEAMLEDSAKEDNSEKDSKEDESKSITIEQSLELLWGNSPPDFNKTITVASDMVEARDTLDALLCASSTDPDNDIATLEILCRRFSPLVSSRDELQQRLSQLVTFSTPGALELALVHRIFTSGQVDGHVVAANEETDDVSDLYVSEADLMPLLIEVNTLPPTVETSLSNVGHMLDVAVNERPTGKEYSLSLVIKSLSGELIWDGNWDEALNEELEAEYVAEEMFEDATGDSNLGGLGLEYFGGAGYSSYALRRLRNALSSADRVASSQTISELAFRAMLLIGEDALTAGKCALAAAQVATEPLRYGSEEGTCVCIKENESRALVAEVVVGVRQWSANYYGLGMAVIVQRRVLIGWDSAQDRGPSDLSWWDGSIVADVCRSHSLNRKVTDELVSHDDVRIDVVEEEMFLDAAEDMDGVLAECHVCLRLRPPHLRPKVIAIPVDDDDEEVVAATETSLVDVGQDGVEGRHAGQVPLADRNNANLIGWGLSWEGCLGLPPSTYSPYPQPLQLSTPLPTADPVVWVACSNRHTVLITSMGSVYTAGDGTDGALGHGDMTSPPVEGFHRVVWFSKRGPEAARPLSASASADLTGCATLVLDADGVAYAFGVGHCSGTGTVRPVMSPIEVAFPDEAGRIAAVACGGGFAMALTKAGKVYSWGSWAGGRLGLGSTPVVSGRHKRAPRFQLRPRLVEGIYDSNGGIVAISAGAVHALALTAGGAVYSWGTNSEGQLGHSAATLSDSWVPRLVEWTPPSQMTQSTNITVSPVIRAIAAGGTHSVAIDASGAVWSWGAGGAACLGHGCMWAPEAVTQGRAGRFVPLSSLRGAGSAHASRAAVQGWSRPMVVAALQGVEVRAASCGEGVSAFLTNSGHMYLCGEGPSISDMSESTGGKPVTLARGVAVPRQPCGTWLPQLEGMAVSAIAVSAAHVIMIAAGDQLGRNLGRKLLDAAITSTESADGAPDIGLSDNLKPDVVLMVAGSYLHAHRCVLAQRSPVLREMISVEERPGRDGTMLELLLPDLRYEVAKTLREYLYTDAITSSLRPTSSLAQDLLTAANTYQIPRLAAICESALSLHIMHPDGAPPPLPPSTISLDLGTALGDPTHADVKFIAGGRAIHAHRLILVASSEYFAAMFRGGMQESRTAATTNKNGRLRKRVPPVEIVVPDSHSGMLRLLLYMYTGRLADAEASPLQLIEDIYAADRYRLIDLRRLCESAIEVDAESCTRALHAADLVGAPRLREITLSYAVNAMGAIALQPGFKDFISQNPSLAEALLERVARSTAWGQQAAEKYRGSQVESRKPRPVVRGEKGFVVEGEPFPWFALCAAIFLAGIYSRLDKIMAIGYAVPAMNVSVFIVMLVWAYRRMRSEATKLPSGGRGGRGRERVGASFLA